MVLREIYALKRHLHLIFRLVMSTRFFTNHGDQTLLKKFQGVFENNPDIEWFDALVGFLRASGYFAIRPFLGKVPHIRILVGINVDAIMADYHRRGLLFLADPHHLLEEFRKLNSAKTSKAQLTEKTSKVEFSSSWTMLGRGKSKFALTPPSGFMPSCTSSVRKALTSINPVRLLQAPRRSLCRRHRRRQDQA